ncbi:molybdopterin-guanine dinucleotide biosynthesis protein B, partial [Deltaproteobacteria bacterium OttesenSCG-928-M10]|nr:molybdopterin-guanine dinucleotide biosynthesis protein B [Deltaproteobacteria bacterium OttesenSCG-928-M10]
MTFKPQPGSAVVSPERPEPGQPLKRAGGPPIVAVSGVKNSGKTSLLAALIPLFRARGLRVGLIKHDGHDFSPDVPGRDSRRLREAGAEAVAVYSPRRYMVTAEKAGVEIDDLLPHFAGVDLVMLEGGKDSPYPKIEVLRAAVSSQPVCRPET